MKLYLNRNQLLYFTFHIIPIFLLGINFIIYNAIGVESFKLLFRIVAISMLFIGWLLDGVKNYTIIHLMFLIAIGFQIIINGTESISLIAFVLIALNSTKSINEELKALCYISIVLTVIVFILIAIGLIDNNTYISTDGRIRSTLGFINPNSAALFYSSCLLLIVGSKENTKVYDLIIFTLLSFVIFYYTACRTIFIADIFYVVCKLIYLFNYKLKIEFFNHVFLFLLDALFVLNLFSALFIDQLLRFNSLTSSRIIDYKRLIDNADLQTWLFGGTDFSADSFYYMLLFKYGIIFYFFIFLISHLAIKQLLYLKQYSIIVFVLTIYICGITESSIIRPELVSMLFIWKTIINESSNWLNNKSSSNNGLKESSI